MPKTWLTAHSGCDGTQDNSMQFVSYALKLDVDCIEVDVRRGANGALVLSHDEGAARTLLFDVLPELCDHPGKKLNCDLKQEGLETAVWALAKTVGVGDQIVFSGTVSAEAAKDEPAIFEHAGWFLNIELLFPEIKTLGPAELQDASRAARMADQLQRFLAANGARCVNSHYMIAITPLYQELMQRGIPLSVWTPDDEQVISRFLQDGVYNITTRNAKRACELARQHLAKGGA